MKQFAPRVGLDLDGVCLDFNRHFLSYLNLPTHNPTDWNDARFVDNFHLIDQDEDFWATMPRIFDPALLTFQPLCYVTARNIDVEITKYSLRVNKFPEAPVISVGRGGSKFKALKEMQADIYLDDHVDNFIELNKAGINTFLITRSHNTYFDAGDKRYDSLLDFQEKFLNKNDTGIRKETLWQRYRRRAGRLFTMDL